MDITVLFKACVKTVRMTNKAIDGGKEKPTNILKKPRDEHLTKAKEVAKQIANLQELLQQHRNAYLNVKNYISTNKTMSEIDRNQIDVVAQKILNACNDKIKEFKKEIYKLKNTKQREEHYLNVIDSLENYLKAVSKFYSEQKVARMKKVMETHQLSKLELNSYNKPESDINNTISKPTALAEDARLNKEIKIPQRIVEHAAEPEDQLSAEEMQMFESENESLFNELNTLSDEVKQIETKVADIAKLQEVFTEKVLEQDKDIDRIFATVTGSTDNMKDANEQIRQAIRRNAGLRVWILFFLLVMSFSLLFLDWYND